MSDLIIGSALHELHKNLTNCPEIEYRKYNQKKTGVPVFYIDFIHACGKVSQSIQATADIEAILVSFLKGEYVSPIDTK